MKFDETNRLLRLDAALTECEGLEFTPEVRSAFNVLFDAVGVELDQKFPVFGDFLDAQEKAVASWYEASKEHLFASRSSNHDS